MRSGGAGEDRGLDPNSVSEPAAPRFPPLRPPDQPGGSFFGDIPEGWLWAQGLRGQQMAGAGLWTDRGWGSEKKTSH